MKLETWTPAPKTMFNPIIGVMSKYCIVASSLTADIKVFILTFFIYFITTTNNVLRVHYIDKNNNPVQFRPMHIHLLNWTSQSPDFALIKNLGQTLKIVVHTYFLWSNLVLPWTRFQWKLVDVLCNCSERWICKVLTQNVWIWIHPTLSCFSFYCTTMH